MTKIQKIDAISMSVVCVGFALVVAGVGLMHWPSSLILCGTGICFAGFIGLHAVPALKAQG